MVTRTVIKQYKVFRLNLGGVTLSIVRFKRKFSLSFEMKWGW